MVLGHLIRFHCEAKLVLIVIAVSEYALSENKY